MKKTYIHPQTKSVQLLNECVMAVPSEEGVTIIDFAKQASEVEEDETGVPNKFSNIWGDEEDKD